MPDDRARKSFSGNRRGAKAFSQQSDSVDRMEAVPRRFDDKYPSSQQEAASRTPPPNPSEV